MEGEIKALYEESSTGPRLLAGPGAGPNIGRTGSVQGSVVVEKQGSAIRRNRRRIFVLIRIEFGDIHWRTERFGDRRTRSTPDVVSSRASRAIRYEKYFETISRHGWRDFIVRCTELRHKRRF